MTEQLQGIIPPMVTPFTDSQDVDFDALRREVRLLLDAGVDGLAVCGSTGEGQTLSPEETLEISRVVVAEVAGQVPVITGIIQDSTRGVMRYADRLHGLGLAALQITPVHYLFNPGPEGHLQYYREIAQLTGMRLIVYNVVPWNSIDVPTLLRLGEIPEVGGVKQSGGDIHGLADLLLRNDGRLRIFSAIDDLLYPSFALGADGAIAAILTVVPDLCVALWRAVQRDDHAEARRLHERILPVWNTLKQPDMSARVKAAIELQGRKVGPARGPLLPVGPAVRKEIASALADAGVMSGARA